MTRFLVFLFIVLFSNTAFADGLYISAGQAPAKSSSIDDNDAFRLTYVKPMEVTWQFLESNHILLDLEFSYLSWKDNTLEDDKHGLSITPFFKYKLAELGSGFDCYIGLGIGASYRNGKQWADRRLGSRWLFEDKAEIAFVYKERHQLALTAIHYSNARLANENDGVNTYMLTYGFWW